MATGQSLLTNSTTEKPKRSFTTRSFEQQQQLWGWLFLSPWIIGFLLFTAIPIIVSFGFTFTNFNLGNPQEWNWVGLKNWGQLFTDPLAGRALEVTFKFAALAVPIGLAIPLAMASILNSKALYGKRLWRTLFYLPYMVPAISGIFIWQSFLNGQTGWLNRLLRLVGVMDPPNWLNDERYMLGAFLLMGTWGAGNAMLTMLATMQGVPTELYEAADVDGANGLTKWFRITFPLITPVVFYNLVLSAIGIMQYFVVPYVVTRTTGGPNLSAYFFNMHLYKTAFTFFDMGYAATMAWVIFLIAIVLTIILFATSRYWVYYAGGE